MRKALASLLLPLCLAPAQTGRTLRLGLKDAVDVALAPEGNTRVQLAGEFTRQAETRCRQALGALLPNIESALSYQSQTRNLAAFGIRIQVPLPGFQMPEFAGPFTVFDVRASATQSVFDFSAIRRYQAARASLDAARKEREHTLEEAVEQVARAYLAALRAEAALETAQANVSLAQSLLDLAAAQKRAGTGTGIEITRAQVQLANERQRLLMAENDLDRARLHLLRTIGLPLDAKVELTDKMSYLPADPLTLAQALDLARQSRADLAAQRGRERAAQLNDSAARGERLPSLVAFGDYGSIGAGLDRALPTRVYGLALRLPIYDGGRRDARRAESAVLLRQERIRARDLQQQIDLEVRLALDALRSADSQVRVSAEGLALAENELEQARRRYQAGVATGIEVADAQTRLQRARDNRILALFHHHLAQIDLYAAIGQIERRLATRQP